MMDRPQMVGLLAGQSNAAGMIERNDLTEYQGRNGVWTRQAGWQHPAGAIVRFLNYLSRSLGATVGIVNTARGGSALLQEAEGAGGYWDGDAGTDTRTDNAVRNMMDAELAKPAFVIWSQGERDAGSGIVSGWQYAQALHRVRARLTRGWIDVPFLIVELVPNEASAANANQRWLDIQAGQWLASGSSPNTHLISISPQQIEHLPNSVHYTDKTLRAQARACAIYLVGK